MSASSQSHCPDSVVLVHFLHSMRVSMNSRSDFFLLLSQCRNGLLMRFCRTASHLPFLPISDNDLRYVIQSVQNICLIVLVDFLQHFVCFVVHVLSQRWSMSDSMGRILLYDVAGD